MGRKSRLSPMKRMGDYLEFFSRQIDYYLFLPKQMEVFAEQLEVVGRMPGDSLTRWSILMRDLRM